MPREVDFRARGGSRWGADASAVAPVRASGTTAHMLRGWWGGAVMR